MKKYAIIAAISVLVVTFAGVYTYLKHKENEWILTQYPDDSGVQGMFYSIAN